MGRPLISTISDLARLRVERAQALAAAIEDSDPRHGTLTELRMQLAGLVADIEQLQRIERGYNELVAEAEEQALLQAGRTGRPN